MTMIRDRGKFRVEIGANFSQFFGILLGAKNLVTKKENILRIQ
jgi:hypothetical protein